MLLYFSPLPWSSFEQRPHKFVKWYHERTGQNVIWVEPYGTRLPNLGDLKRLFSQTSDNVQTERPAWLSILKPKSFPVEPLPLVNFINHFLWSTIYQNLDELVRRVDKLLIVVGKPSQLALRYAMRLNVEAKVIYDCMDEFPSFYRGLSRRSMALQHQKLARCADTVIVSSSHLINSLAVIGVKAKPVFNGLDPSYCPQYNEVKQLDNSDTNPVFGYVGTIAEWFDWVLIAELARCLPHTSIRLVGPLITPPDTRLPKNIEILPPLEHSAAIKTMQTFSVGLIPFKLNALTQGVDPIKFYEYRALGIPVLSTNFGEMANRREEPGCFIGDDTKHFISLAMKAAGYKKDKLETDSFIKMNSWYSRFDSANLL